jgi:hypothetical protein
MKVAFAPDGKTVIAGGGVSRRPRAVVNFPGEQVRVYKVTEISAPTAP